MRESKLTGISEAPLSVKDKVSPPEIVTQYNNFYEFGTGKDEPAPNARIDPHVAVYSAD